MGERKKKYAIFDENALKSILEKLSRRNKRKMYWNTCFFFFVLSKYIKCWKFARRKKPSRSNKIRRPATKDLNYISMLPNFLSLITFLPGESWAFLTESSIDYSSDLTQKSGKFWSKIVQLLFCRKIDYLSHFGDVRMKLRPSSRKRRILRFDSKDLTFSSNPNYIIT